MSTPGDQFEINSDQRMIAGIAYGLYALALFGLFLPAIAGIIINYLKVDESLPLYAAHHRWMIRTFWFGLGWSILGSILTLVLAGFVVLFVVWVWWLYRMIRGFLALLDNKPPTPVGAIFP